MANEIKITVTGDTDYTNSSEFLDFMDRILLRYKKVYIRTGDYSGAELLARAYSRSNVRRTYVVTEIDYKPKGLLRESVLLDNSDLAIVIWNGVEEAAVDLMVEANLRKIPVKVLTY